MPKYSFDSLSIIIRRLRESRIFRALDAVVSWQPFTFRGVLAIALSLFALIEFAIPEKDLIAAVLGGSMLALAVALSVVSLVLRVLLRSRISAELNFDETDPRSRADVLAGIVLSRSDIPPYFSLQITRQFDFPHVETKAHLVRGRAPKENKRYLLDSVRFQHRGFWTVTHLEIMLEDALGITSLRWASPVSASIEVSAPSVPIRPLPIVAASSRAGDQLNQSQERAGDPFDIKPYDQSDGMRRILWKTFAKSGELMVRRPETAIIPEGEVAVYLVADLHDDVVAGALQSYIRQLEDGEITILFGTDGLAGARSKDASAGAASAGGSNNSGAGGKGRAYLSDIPEIFSAMNRSVWSPRAGTGSDFQGYLESLARENRAVHRVIVFTGSNTSGGRSPARVSSAGAPEAASGDARTTAGGASLWLNRVAKAAAAHGAQLTIVVVPDELDPLAKRVDRADDLIQLIKRLPSQVAVWKPGISAKQRSGQGALPVTASISKTGAELLIAEAYR